MMKEAHITVRDKEGRMATVVIDGCNSRTAAKALATFVNTHSAAQVVQWKFVDGEILEGAAGEGKYNSVDQQNVLLFADPDGYPINFVLPAPQESTLDEAQEATAGFAGAVQGLLLENTSLTDLFYKGGGLTAQADMP